MTGRVRFPGNPWPAGHAIAETAWTAQLGPDGLRFGFHLVTARYDAEDPGRERSSDEDEFGVPGVWTNYGRCTLSSSKWGHAGLLVATPGRPIDLARLDGATLRADPMTGSTLPADFDRERGAFGLYLLGHDTAVDHRIGFVRRRAPWTYDVRWRARIALTYIGHRDLRHALDASLTLHLDRIELAPELPRRDARGLLEEIVIGADRLALGRRGFTRTA